MLTNHQIIKHIPRGKKLIAVAAVATIALSTSSALAFNSLSGTGASDTPVEVTVDDHEQRITKNEQDIAATKDRVGQVEQKAGENSQAIGQTTERVTVVERQVAAPQQQVAPPPASAPAQEAPAPTINPRRVAAMTLNINGFGQSEPLWNCTYTLEGGTSFQTFQGYACHVVGSEISDDIAAMHGIGR